MKVVAQNRRSRFDYEILETVEAGIQLTGPEVKSCRNGHINLSGAYVSFLSGQPILKNAAIARYVFASQSEAQNERRDRLLLLKTSERKKLEAKAEERGFTVVPLEVHAGKFIKLLLGVGRGRKRIDKRMHIREREIARKVREGREV